MECCVNFAGQARHKIAIYKQTTARDELGAADITWVLIREAKAIVTPLSGREVFRFEQMESTCTHKFLVKYSSSLEDTRSAAKYKIVFKGRTFPIMLVRNLHTDLKTYGKAYQEILADDGGAELSA